MVTIICWFIIVGGSFGLGRFFEKRELKFKKGYKIKGENNLNYST